MICDIKHMTLLIKTKQYNAYSKIITKPPIVVAFFGCGEGVFVCVGGGCSGDGWVVVGMVGKWGLGWICGYVGGVRCGAFGGVGGDGSVGDFGGGGGGKSSDFVFF